MKVISWNVNVRRGAEGQVAALAAYAPDVVALQEVTAAGVRGERTAVYPRNRECLYGDHR